MVASDDRYGLFLSFGIMTSIFAALSAGEQALNGFQHFDGLTVLFPFFLSLLFLLSAWHFRKLNRRRQAATRGDLSVPLAAEQPTSNEAALPLPITITLMASRGRSYAIGGCFGLLILLSGLLLTFWDLFISSPPDQGQPGAGFTIIFLLIFIFGLALGLAILTSITLRRSAYKITATEEGLTVQQSWMTFNTRWREARLFAIIPTIKRTGQPNAYELSSIAAFTPLPRWRPHSLSLFSLFKPALPFDEYDRQMDALLSLIAAKTGLSLYDLRG